MNTIKVIDELLRVTLPQGPNWYRYNYDGYGEHEDGSPFDGRGIGRPWPLLAGERAHYELAAGHVDSAGSLLGVMENSTAVTRLIPEQVWDQKDIPERELFAGKGWVLVSVLNGAFRLSAMSLILTLLLSPTKTIIISSFSLTSPHN